MPVVVSWPGGVFPGDAVVPRNQSHNVGNVLLLFECLFESLHKSLVQSSEEVVKEDARHVNSLVAKVIAVIHSTMPDRCSKQFLHHRT